MKNVLRVGILTAVIAALQATAMGGLVNVPELHFQIGVPDGWQAFTQKELKTFNNPDKNVEFVSGYYDPQNPFHAVAFQKLPTVNYDPKTNMDKMRSRLPAGSVTEWDEARQCMRVEVPFMGLYDKVFVYCGGKDTVAVHCICPQADKVSMNRKYEAIANTFRFDQGYGKKDYSWFMDNLPMIAGIGGGVLALMLFMKLRKPSF